MFLSTQHVCGFILVYVTHWCDAYTLDNRAQQIDLCFKHILSENTVRFAKFVLDGGAVLGWIVVALPRSQGLVIWDLRVKTGTDIGNECTQKMHDRSLRMP